MLYIILKNIFLFIFKTVFRLRVEGLHNIPNEGAVILCSNHISYMDPPLVGSPLKRRVNFMAKAELFEVPILKYIIPRVGAFPVKRGGVSKESIRLSLNILREGRVLCIFPEGTRSDTVGMGKKGAASFALKSQATVIPVAIIGNYKPFRKLRIKYGQPVDLSEFTETTSETLDVATEKIMQAIRELKAS